MLNQPPNMHTRLSSPQIHGYTAYELLSRLTISLHFNHLQTQIKKKEAAQ